MDYLPGLLIGAETTLVRVRGSQARNMLWIWIFMMRALKRQLSIGCTKTTYWGEGAFETGNQWRYKYHYGLCSSVDMPGSGQTLPA